MDPADDPSVQRPQPEREGLRVVELTTAETHPIRLVVLRADTPTKDVTFPEDDWPGVFHLGVVDRERLVATSTWVPRPFAGAPDSNAMQLRGMATLLTHQGRGIGARLISVGCERARASGVRLVWANARDAALPFYRRNDFVVIGEGFVDATTQLPHHVVLREL